MDYENFKESFKEALQEDLYGKGIEARFDMKSVEKLNNEGYDAVTVTPADSNIGVTLNVEAFYKAHESGASMDEVVSKASDTVIRGFDNQPSIDVASLMDYEQMKDKLIMEVVSTEANADMLANVPHVEMEDMSVVYRFVIDSNDDGRATILATNNMIEAMGVTPEQLHEDALKNAPELKPAVITGMSEVMAEMMGMSPEEMAMMGMPTDPADEQMFVATVPDKIHGAGVLAYQDFMDQAAERVGGSFYILPSSLHEVLLVPDNGQMNLQDLEAMVREVNATQVAPEDKLTDNVYHYDAEAMVVTNARFHYKGIYIEQMNTMLKLMFDAKDYASVTKYAGNILVLNPRSVEIHCWRMMALFKLGKLELMKGAQDSAEEYLDEKEFVLLQNMVESAVRRETSLDFTRGKYEVIFHSMHMKDGRFVGRNAEYARNLAAFDRNLTEI